MLKHSEAFPSQADSITIPTSGGLDQSHKGIPTAAKRQKSLCKMAMHKLGDI
jgi:hypothetical protein